MWMWMTLAVAAPPIQARHDGIPDEIEACRDRGALWLSDPDSFEKTAIENDSRIWVPVWQVRDRHAGHIGHLLVYPNSCRVVTLALTPRRDGPPGVEVVAPPGSKASTPELLMLFRWAGLAD